MSISDDSVRTATLVCISKLGLLTAHISPPSYIIETRTSHHGRPRVQILDNTKQRPAQSYNETLSALPPRFVATPCLLGWSRIRAGAPSVHLCKSFLSDMPFVGSKGSWVFPNITHLPSSSSVRWSFDYQSPADPCALDDRIPGPRRSVLVSAAFKTVSEESAVTNLDTAQRVEAMQGRGVTATRCLLCCCLLLFRPFWRGWLPMFSSDDDEIESCSCGVVLVRSDGIEVAGRWRWFHLRTDTAKA